MFWEPTTCFKTERPRCVQVVCPCFKHAKFRLGLHSMEEALVDYNMHSKRYGSLGVLVQPERNMNHDAYIR